MDTACEANIAARMMMGLNPVAMDLGEGEVNDTVVMPAEEELPADDILTQAAEADREVAAAAKDDADDVPGRANSSDALADPGLEMGSRQAVELNEMICTQTGQNCAAAKMARRHHVERYGRF